MVEVEYRQRLKDGLRHGVLKGLRPEKKPGLSIPRGPPEPTLKSAFAANSYAWEKEERTLPLYMSQFSYTSETWAALVKNPEDRAETVRALAEKMGGKMHSLHYCFGEYDGVIIMEAPDETTIMAILLAAISPGHVKAIKTTTLITVQQAMAAMRKAGTAAYRAPKG